MSAACLYVASALVAALPSGAFTLTWTHSVEKTTWTERYRVERDALVLVEASVEGSGAGMEPPPDAVLDGARWTWRPERRIPELLLRRSGYTGDYTLCTSGRCGPLGELAGASGPDATVTLRPCPSR